MYDGFCWSNKEVSDVKPVNAEISIYVIPFVSRSLQSKLKLRRASKHIKSNNKQGVERSQSLKNQWGNGRD